MTACGAEELSRFLPRVQIGGTICTVAPSGGPVRVHGHALREWAARTAAWEAGVPPCPAPGSSPCQARPGWVGMDCFRVCVRSGGCHMSLPFPNAVGRRPRCALLWPARGPSWADCWAVANDGISFFRGPRGLPSIKVDSRTDPSPSNIYPAAGKLRGLDRK